jgi:hypothetical protein
MDVFRAEQGSFLAILPAKMGIQPANMVKSRLIISYDQNLPK